MARNLNNPIFFDERRRRWWYSKRTLAILGAFLFTIFGFGISSIFFHPVLPSLNLEASVPQYGSAIRTPAPDTATPASQSTQSQDTVMQKLDAILKAPNLNANSAAMSSNKLSSSNSKVIGFYVNWDENSLVSLKQNISKMDELIPEWLHLDGSDGSIVVDDQAIQDRTVAYIKQNRPDLPIAPLINNFNQTTQQWDGAALSAMLESPVARGKTIQNILDFVESKGFSGVSIDFETVADNQQGNLALFMGELYAKFHPLNLEVSQNIPLEDTSFNAKILGKSSDFLILMAYDENSIGDGLAGPIASNRWFASSLLSRFSELPPSKYVVAIGNYGYDWEDKKTTGDDITYQDAIRIAQDSNASPALDPKSLNPYFDYNNNGVLRHVWYLDAITAFNEIKISGSDNGPRGYALWRLGSEDPDVWNVLAGRNKLDAQLAGTLGTMRYGYGVIYEGQGEVLKVTGTPKTGKREISYTDKDGITQEKITDFSNAYTVTRWGGNDPKKIALTFDDGPDKNYTPQILKILQKFNVPATFFTIGLNADLNSNILKQEIAQGDEIGNHTYTHPDITKISDSQFKLELSATERLFEAVTGHDSLFFRPPYAEDIEPESPEQIRPLLVSSNLGYFTVGMHIDPSDWSKPGADAIVNEVMRSATAGEGNIVLLHDGGGNRSQTIAALPQIIEGLQKKGFQLVTVSDLVGSDKQNFLPAVSASQINIARVNRIMDAIISNLSRFFYWMFFIGIVFGVARFLFIGILAGIQWVYSRRAVYKKYESIYFPQVSVVIAAYNEEKVIVQTLSSILSSDYPNFNIIVVDDGSKDGTYEILLKFFGNNPWVKIFSKKNGGKADALNFGIERTNSEIIVTLDADTVFRRDTIAKLVRVFVDFRVGAVAGNAKVGNRINIMTRWQALEYIVNQNLDKRAFEVLNCISVVPGAIGAWRRVAILEAGGFSKSTLAEDADLTFSILSLGYRVAYEDEAIAYTEAPDTVRNFVKQRFRWMYGTFQTAWKHRDVIWRGKNRSLSIFTLPNILIFQILFPLVSPFMDLILVFSLFWAFWQSQMHLDYSAMGTFRKILFYYIFFLGIDFLTAMIPFLLEKKEQWSLLIWMPLQRFFYRQLMYYVALKSIFTAIKGRIVGWGKFERKATMRENI
jgi:cellulose synthase/poly-beta-1,6-N-acetylglucosamine synthase-like glycosyltransferase/peptidoglycan/xylan/chitin deacetylase (PgdA/CDA1 family)/spore germination protein YaaH